MSKACTLEVNRNCERCGHSLAISGNYTRCPAPVWKPETGVVACRCDCCVPANETENGVKEKMKKLLIGILLAGMLALPTFSQDQIPPTGPPGGDKTPVGCGECSLATWDAWAKAVDACLAGQAPPGTNCDEWGIFKAKQFCAENCVACSFCTLL